MARPTHRVIVLTVLAMLLLGIAVAPATAHGKTKVKTLRNFESVIATGLDPSEEFGVDLMEMRCSLLIRWEAADGTAREVQHCRVTDPITEGAAPPSKGVFVDDEECVWFSDWHLSQDPPVDWVAEEFRGIVFPSGRVLVAASYGTDPMAGCDF